MNTTSSQDYTTGSCSDKAGACAADSKKEAGKNSDECCGGGTCETKTVETKTVETKHACGCG